MTRTLWLLVLVLAASCRPTVVVTPDGGAGSGGTEPVPVATGGTGGVVAVTGGTAPAPACKALIRTAPEGRVRAKQRLLQARIINGKLAARGAWPASTALETLNGFPYCGATLISGRCALTAAHCEVEPGELVVAGLNDLEQPGGRIEVVETRTHKGYLEPSGLHDVAILRLRTDAMGLPSGFIVGPALLVETGWVGTGGNATVVGWGLTQENGAASSLLREVTVPIQSPAVCSGAYPGIVSTLFCAGSMQGGADSCQGDSGGAIYVQQGGKMVIAGVVSRGNGCGRAGYPGEYTDVGQEREWIDECTRDCW